MTRPVLIFSSPLSHLPGFARHSYDGIATKKVTTGKRRQKEKENTMKWM
jgi:hypothetical protein